MPEHTKISFNHRREITDYSDLVEMLFPGNRNQQHAAACILFELRVLFLADLKDRNYNSEIKLRTNDIHASEVIIPVKASIMSKESGENH